MTSSAAPPADDSQRPLAESIAVATRSVHAKLNRLIIARLPLATPPHAADPSIYVSGLLHITPVYATFESLWRTIAESPQPSVTGVQRDAWLALASPEPNASSKHPAPLCERTRSILTALYLPGLMRSDRLRSDIGALTGWSPEVVEEQLKAVAEAGRLAEFTHHVKRTIEKKPHVLMAYSYILFMALFAGGRFIRAVLESAGPEFWGQVPAPIPPSQKSCQAHDPMAAVPSSAAMGSVDLMRGDHRTIRVGTKHSRQSLPLGFFHFATVLDGEDLKAEFKKRLSESESLLTPQERNDIIQEAVCIFDNMLLLVDQLDDVCETSLEDGSAAPPWASLTSGGRLRDSLAVARERKSEKTGLTEPEASERSSSWVCKHARQKTPETANTQGLSDLEKQPPAYCPAPKSIRFGPKLPVPHRKEDCKTRPTVGTTEVAASQQRLLPCSSMYLISNTILVVGLAVVVSMIFFSRRLVDKNQTIEEEW
ncbi:hypothetical protein CH63R_04372 [Colletotrichum higginsianum IMI 349063]|uniref:Heme-binding protein HMX1 n=1 Tax=Colletotrichum higginsianum (strain IMI 349063) TaxID=759273 RepID=A0A1B7YJ60_COLHI|nr:hypothetical protein CH63R_04372 [Colletotrichum higginsianum IMI 349063]OBR12076.1 hypothetical protein CH63R_04372 [Colletotrichum higginsianum IMI 349063]